MNDLVESLVNDDKFNKFVYSSPTANVNVSAPSKTHHNQKGDNDFYVEKTRSRKESEAQQDMFMDDDDSEAEDAVEKVKDDWKGKKQADSKPVKENQVHNHREKKKNPKKSLLKKL